MYFIFNGSKGITRGRIRHYDITRKEGADLPIARLRLALRRLPASDVAVGQQDLDSMSASVLPNVGH